MSASTKSDKATRLTPVERYEYDVWGNVLGVYDGSGQSLPSSGIGNRYLFQGREYSWAVHEAWGGAGLYYFRARWYDPVTGRWLSNDPIGISGGLNQYVFAGNNPVNSSDPLGLDERKGANAGGIVNKLTNSVNVYASEYGVTNVPSGQRTPPGDWDSVEIPAGSGNWQKIGPGDSTVAKDGTLKSGARRWIDKAFRNPEGYKPSNIPKPPLPKKCEQENAP